MNAGLAKPIPEIWFIGQGAGFRPAITCGYAVLRCEQSVLVTNES